MLEHELDTAHVVVAGEEVVLLVGLDVEVRSGEVDEYLVGTDAGEHGGYLVVAHARAHDFGILRAEELDFAAEGLGVHARCRLVGDGDGAAEVRLFGGNPEGVATRDALHDGNGDIVLEVEDFEDFGHHADGVEVGQQGLFGVGALREDGDVLLRAADVGQEAARLGPLGGDGNEDSGEEDLVHDGQHGHLGLDAVVGKQEVFVDGVDDGHYVGADVDVLRYDVG